MPRRSPAHSTYARIVGEIAIAWNELELRLLDLIGHYFAVESYIAEFVVGQMGNETRAEFATLLIERYERDALLKEHGLHLVALLNRIRENRNILEHALPVSWSGEYHGKIYKFSKRGKLVPFNAPIDALKALMETMQSASPYATWIVQCLTWNQGGSIDGVMTGEQTAEWGLTVLALLDRPQLPDKIAPLQLPEGQAGD